MLKESCRMWQPSDWDIPHLTDCRGWFSWSVWLGRCPLTLSSLHVCPSQTCAFSGRRWPSSIEEDHSLIKGGQEAVLPYSSIQTSWEGPFVGKGRRVKLLRLQTHPNEALHEAVCLYFFKKKSPGGISVFPTRQVDVVFQWTGTNCGNCSR